MRGARFIWDDGEIVNVSERCHSEEVHSVHQDSIGAMRHPVTGKIYDSKGAYLRETKRLGYEVVGNEKLSERPSRFKDKLTDAVVYDKIQKAEAILSDPARRREYQNMNYMLAERNKRLLNGRR